MFSNGKRFLAAKTSKFHSATNIHINNFEKIEERLRQLFVDGKFFRAQLQRIVLIKVHDGRIAAFEREVKQKPFTEHCFLALIDRSCAVRLRGDICEKHLQSALEVRGIYFSIVINHAPKTLRSKHNASVVPMGTRLQSSRGMIRTHFSNSIRAKRRSS